QLPRGPGRRLGIVLAGGGVEDPARGIDHQPGAVGGRPVAHHRLDVAALGTDARDQQRHVADDPADHLEFSGEGGADHQGAVAVDVPSGRDRARHVLVQRRAAVPARAARIVATACVLCFGLALVWMCWAWMDPAGIARHGFDAQAYAADSFNFLYTERTQTLNWPTWVLRLVLPLFAVCLTLHALSNLFEDLAWVPRQSRKDFPVASPDMVN